MITQCKYDRMQVVIALKLNNIYALNFYLSSYVRYLTVPCLLCYPSVILFDKSIKFPAPKEIKVCRSSVVFHIRLTAFCRANQLYETFIILRAQISPGDLVQMDQSKPSCDALTFEAFLPANQQQLKWIYKWFNTC